MLGLTTSSDHRALLVEYIVSCLTTPIQLFCEVFCWLIRTQWQLVFSRSKARLFVHSWNTLTGAFFHMFVQSLIRTIIHTYRIHSIICTIIHNSLILTVIRMGICTFFGSYCHSHIHWLSYTHIFWFAQMFTHQFVQPFTHLKKWFKQSNNHSHYQFMYSLVLSLSLSLSLSRGTFALCGVIKGDGSGYMEATCDDTTCKFGGTCEYEDDGDFLCRCSFNCPALRYVPTSTRARYDQSALCFIFVIGGCYDQCAKIKK